MANYNLPSSMVFVSKAEIATQAQTDADAIISNGQELEALVAIASMVEYCEDLKAALKESAMEKADALCGEKSTAEFRGAKIQIKEGAARYDFKGVKCIADLEKKLKDLKDICKASSEDTPYVHLETGEVVKGVKKTCSPDTIAIILNK